MSVRTQRPSSVLVDHPTSETQRSMTISAEMVRCLLPEFDEISITVIEGSGQYATWAQTSSLSSGLDQLQYDLGEGPFIDSLQTGVVVASHIQREHRWSNYVSSASQLGLRSQVAVPLCRPEGQPLGALNMYSTTQGDVGAVVPLIAKGLANQIVVLLTHLEEIENLHHALDSRKTIGIAVGVLMGQYQLTERAAFEVMRRRSSQTNVKLRDIAEGLVADQSAAGHELPAAAVC